ncbi:hypothetical protein BD410DRAFT_735994 [Rickenella mellea]|uniref:Ras GTPase-activating protein n=1 Tax=Rickenella mellea TaxID=50990 RepID=A0A4R5XFU6_9AGAM|nr:hypothetical protein BD410DRAFT_735994 [Rickenella mellea]
MDRSNSTSSTSSAGSSRQSTTEPFAYQTRLLERTSSLSRSNSQSTRGLFPVPTGPTSPTAWKPRHRVGNSIDSVRSKWEALAEAGVASSGSRESISSGEPSTPFQATPDSSNTSPEPSPSFKSSHTFKSPVAVTVSHDDSTPRRVTPPLLKRHTLPAPIFASPLSPNNTGITVESPEPRSNSFTAPTHRIHLPVAAQSPTSPFTGLKRSNAFVLPSQVSGKVDTSSPRSRRSIDFDAIRSSNVGSSEVPYRTQDPPKSADSLHSRTPIPTVETPRRARPTSLYASPSPRMPSPEKSTGPTVASNPIRPRPPVAVDDVFSDKSNQPSAVSSNVMSPTPYRSSYMANKKASTYGDSLVVGRKLGRHLPRIASGDASSIDEGPPQVPPKVEVKEVEKTPEEKARLSRIERREARMREWEQQMERDVTPRRRVHAAADELMGPDITSVNDVAGIPGRLRLSKDKGPSAPSTPIPSAKITSTRGLWADTQRHLLQAYEYLCHVGEAQQWIEGCLGEELGFGVVEMDEGLRNGVVLAKLVRVFQGDSYVRKIYEGPKLSFLHSDNINYFFGFVKLVGLPDCFQFELTDLYDKKNIPKVIYCIHALSHLLARRGLAERIGNLVGTLKFSDDQLQQTEKGLKASGVAMPNFGNVGKQLAKEINEEPEVEVESEEERRDRLLLECEASIIQMQSIARGFLTRKAQGTQRVRLRLAERYIPKMQAHCRGALTRRHIQQERRNQSRMSPWIISLQASARGLIARRAWRARLTRIRAARRYVIKIQAQARGVLQRRRFGKLKSALSRSHVSVVKFQALAKAKLARKAHQQVHKVLEHPRIMRSVAAIQAVARGLLVRRNMAQRHRAIARIEKVVIGLQAQARGVITRRQVGAQLAKLDDSVDVVIRIQAAARCYLARKRLLNLIRGLRKATVSIVGLQSRARANLQRKHHQNLNKVLAEVHVVKSVGGFQALARAAIVRKRHEEQSKRLEFIAPNVVGLQAVARGVLLRQDFIAWRDHLRSSQAEATFLQALIRGVLQRRLFRAKMQHYRANMDKVVKIQSLFRAKETREQYRQLTLGKNVNVGTIKNFVHLLDDSEADFEDEIEVERLRKKVVENIRENQALETDVNELDVKIALVVNNLKSFEDLIKVRRRHGADSAAVHASRASVLAAHGDPFAGPNTLDHATRRKLELYQQLFYLLQTQGEYLSRLFFRLSSIDVEDKPKRLAERVALTLFGYGQDRREEYLLLKLFQMTIHEDVFAARTMSDLIQGSAMYVNVAILYARPKQVAYVRDALQTVIREVIHQEDLDLETDPCVIYRRLTSIEEMRSGERSRRPTDVTFHQAVEDPETRGEYIRHLQKLHAYSKAFIKAIMSSTKKMPYGIRCIARELLNAIREKFPSETEAAYAACIGRLIYNRYINPAILAPEAFDIVPGSIGVPARKNLNEISKMLLQISSGFPFADDTPALTPLNSYVAEAIPQFSAWFMQVTHVPEAESHFHAHEFLDATVQSKPIYISPNEVYSMHSLLSQHLDHLAPDRDDLLRVILKELGGVPNLGTTAELKDARDRAVTLELTNRFANVKDPHADEKALWVQAKRGVLAILRVQPSKDLVESLMLPVTDDHEMIWEDIVDREMLTDRVRQRQRRMPSVGGTDLTYRLEDIQSLSFREVKAHAIHFLLELEKKGKVTRADGYQAVLNAIAGDVRSKHRKRLQRQQELASMNEALAHLAERKKYFEDQIKSYHDVVESSMKTMQRGKGKKRIVIPFSKQFFHLRELQKYGKSPQYGSFVYSGSYLYGKGVLLDMDKYSPKQLGRFDFVLSSNEAGVFDFELHDKSSGTAVLLAETEVRMEDLLQAQFESRPSIPLFNGLAIVNVNLLLYQINKKFYA